MTKANLRLLNKFLTKKDQPVDPDRINDGAFGLMKAVERWDRFSRYRFSTYAAHYIRSYANRAHDECGSNIRLPVHIHEKLNKLWHAEKKLLDQNDELPSADRLGRELDMPVSKIRRLMRIIREDRPLESQKLRGHANLSVGIDFFDSFPAPWGDPHLLATQSKMHEKIADVLTSLTPREERVIKMRFGLEDGDEQTLDDVAASFQLTRERIRQIEAKALRRLRHPSRARRLRPLLQSQSSDCVGHAKTDHQRKLDEKCNYSEPAYRPLPSHLTILERSGQSLSGWKPKTISPQ